MGWRGSLATACALLAGMWAFGCGDSGPRAQPCAADPLSRFGECPEAQDGGDDGDDELGLDLGADPRDVTSDRGALAGDLSDATSDGGRDATEAPDLLTPGADADDVSADDSADAGEDAAPSICPPRMMPVGDACMDRYEAPNVPGSLPLVMYTYYEAQAWCAARGKRLCYDDEWTTACEGADQTAYPYGNTRVPGICRDDAVWRTYDQSLLNGWPEGTSTPDIESLAELLTAVRSRGTAATAAADHVEWLYQGEGSGVNTGCVNEYGVYDLVGNIEEWTTRRDGGEGPDFSGNLKGRYWADTRRCQDNIRSHGNAFRFYEIGFRCCADRVAIE